jgi:hypothetical protein
MNVWNRIGDLAEGTKDWIGDIGLGLVSPAKFVWDVATAPLNDRKEYDGFLNSIKQAGTDFVKNVARPVGGVLGAINAVNQNVIREPLSAAALFAQTGDFKKSWEARNEISVGQSIAGLIGKTSPIALLPDAWTPDFMDSNFDIFDKKKRDAAFKESVVGKVTSGALDFTAQFVGDVTIVGGKISKAAFAADKAIDAIKGIRAASAGETNAYSKMAEDFANNDMFWASKHSWVKDGNNQATSSYLLGITTTKEEALNTMLALMGDSSGIDRLSALKRPDIAEPLRVASGEISKSDLKILLREEELMLKGQDEGMIPLNLRSEEEILADREYLAAWAAHDKYVDTLFELSGEAPITKGLGRFSQETNKFTATARSVLFHDMTPGKAQYQAYQPTVYHKLYAKVSWLAGERPSGMVNLNEGDSIREITAIAERLVSISKEGNLVQRVLNSSAKFSYASAMRYIDEYAAAVTPEARALVVNKLEAKGYQIIAAKHGVNPDVAAKLYNHHLQTRSGKLGEIRKEGFLYDNETQTMLNVPLLESQTANFLPVADFDTIEKVIKSEKRILNTIGFKAERAAEVTSDLWKASVLLRLGYPIRNAVDSQLRIWATVGAMASLRHFGEGSRNIVDNLSQSKMGSRLIDRFTGVERVDYKTVKDATMKTGKELSKHKAEILKIQKQLELDPQNPDLVGQLAVQKNLFETKTMVYNANNDSLTRLEEGRLNPNKKTIGQGDFRVKSQYETADGEGYTVYDGFGGQNGGLYRELNSSERSFSSLLEDYSSLYGATVSSRVRGAVTPSDANYYQEWAKAINEDFANSAVTRELLSGKSVQDVAKWLEDNAALRARLSIARGDALEHVAQVKSFVDNYIPDGYGIREQMVGSYAKLKNQHPNLKEYKDGGMGGLPETRSVVGFVDTAYLAKMPGNLTDKEGVNFYRTKIQSGEGFENPITVWYDNDTGLAYVGEGNHRLQAAIKEGLSAVPVRVVRGIVREEPKVDDKGIKFFPETTGRKNMQVKNGKTLPFTTQGPKGPMEYMPTDVHPSFIFDKEYIVDPNFVQSKITPAFLRDAIRDPEALPIVHGHLIEEGLTRKSASVARRITEVGFKYLGTMPENAWARHPLFVDLYRKSITERINTLEQLKGGKFTREEFDKIQYGLEKAARADALKGVKGILYNVERRSNAAHMLRFISPFFSAQENAIKTWLKIAKDNPVVVNRAAIAWTAPNRLGLITNPDTGEQVPAGEVLNSNDTMWFQVPGGLKKLPIIGKGLTSLDQVGISKKSLDVIFQGNPFGVSIGPLTAIPASQIMKMKPELGDVLSFAFPYGPDASIKQLAPTWLRRQFDRNEGMNSSDYAKWYQLIWITEQHKAREEGRPYLTEKEVKGKVDAYYNMRTAANLILPFAPQFDSPYRFYMDKWREYSTKFGLQADDKFLEDFPEYFDFATTLSKNPTGSRSTMDEVQNSKRYSGLISDISQDDKTLIGLVTRGSNAAKFSPTAYWWQSETAISPGSPETFRGKQTPQEAQRANEARRGWAVYRKTMAILDNHLAQRGLTSYQQNGAEDLLAVKNNIVAQLAVETDPVTGKSTGVPSAWYQDYRDVDGLKTAKTIVGLRKIVSNSKFMADNGSDPTWKSMSLYLEVRDAIASRLAGRPVRNIDAKENTDLRMMFDYYVNQLKSGDVEFADIFERYLSQDKVYDKYIDSGI